MRRFDRLSKSEGMFVPISRSQPNSQDQVCRGGDPNDNSGSYFTVVTVKSLSECRQKCVLVWCGLRASELLERKFCQEIQNLSENGRTGGISARKFVFNGVILGCQLFPELHPSTLRHPSLTIQVWRWSTSFAKDPEMSESRKMRSGARDV